MLISVVLHQKFVWFAVSLATTVMGLFGFFLNTVCRRQLNKSDGRQY